MALSIEPSPVACCAPEGSAEEWHPVLDNPLASDAHSSGNQCLTNHSVDFAIHFKTQVGGKIEMLGWLQMVDDWVVQLLAGTGVRFHFESGGRHLTNRSTCPCLFDLLADYLHSPNGCL